jgi:WD40 repeat protein
LDANAFLQRSWRWGESLRQRLQAASQEPAASFLSRGAASTLQILGLPLVQWVGKPEGRYPGVCTLTDHSEGVDPAAFSPDGTRIVSGSHDGRVTIWDVATAALVSIFVGECVEGCGGGVGAGVSRMRGCEDRVRFETSLVCSVFEHALCWRWYERRVCSQVWTLEGHLGAVTSVAFSRDGKWIVSGSMDKLVKIWDADAGAEVCIHGHSRMLERPVYLRVCKGV